LHLWLDIWSVVSRVRFGFTGPVEIGLGLTQYGENFEASGESVWLLFRVREAGSVVPLTMIRIGAGC
jgi:hypothetical protein